VQAFSSVNEDYYFIDVNTDITNLQGYRKQFNAIWKDAFNSYQKSEKCCSCVLDVCCRGYSTLESEAGFAQYSPITVDDILAQYDR
jgi:hypothetical protein